MASFHYRLLCLFCCISFLASCELRKKEMPQNPMIESAFYYSDLVFLSEASEIKCKSSTECRYFFKVERVIKGSSSHKGEEYYIDGEFENEYGRSMFGFLSETGSLEHSLLSKGDKVLLILESVDEKRKQMFPFKVHKNPYPRSLDEFGKIYLVLRWNWAVEIFERWLSDQKKSDYRPPEGIGKLLGSGSDFEKSIYEIPDFWNVTFFDVHRSSADKLGSSPIVGKLRINKILKGQRDTVEGSVYQFIASKDTEIYFWRDLLLGKTKTLSIGLATSTGKFSIRGVKLLDQSGASTLKDLLVLDVGQNIELILKVHNMKNYIPPLDVEDEEFGPRKKEYLFPLPKGQGTLSH